MSSALTEIQLESSAFVFKALGHPARLRMVYALRGGEKCVCELQELIGLDISTVSRHLALLKKEGIVSSRKEGTWAYYSLNLPCVVSLIECVTNKL